MFLSRDLIFPIALMAVSTNFNVRNVAYFGLSKDMI